MVDEPTPPKELTKADVLAAVAAKGDVGKADPAVTAKARASFIAGARTAHLMKYPNLQTPGVPSIPFDEAGVGAAFDAKITGRVMAPTNVHGPVLTAEMTERMVAQLRKHGVPEDRIQAALKGTPSSTGQYARPKDLPTPEQIAAKEKADLEEKEKLKAEDLKREEATRARLEKEKLDADAKSKSDAAQKRVADARAALAAAEAELKA